VTDETQQQFTQKARPSLSIDWELYASYLEESDLPEDQKREFIETLWAIVIACVDMGFGIHPVQQACAQEEETSPSIQDAMVNYLHSDQYNASTNNAVEKALPSPAEREDS
jgi:hypothetical protein